MARTWDKRGLVIHVPTNTHLDLVERTGPEGASQTFKAGAPLYAASGLLLEFVAPTTGKAIAFALSDGQNTTGAKTKIILWTPDMEFYANLLTTSAADYVMLAADMYKAYDLAKGTNYPTTGAGQWYLQATTSDVAAAAVELIADDVPPTEQIATGVPAVGDTNTRLRCRLLGAGSLLV